MVVSSANSTILVSWSSICIPLIIIIYLLLFNYNYLIIIIYYLPQSQSCITILRVDKPAKILG